MSQTSHIRVTLDVHIRDDYELPGNDIEWAEMLGLEGNESVEAEVKIIDEASRIYEESTLGW